MKIILFIICSTSVTLAYTQAKKTTPAKPVGTNQSVPLLKNSLDSLSYAIGLEGASYYKQQGATSLNTVLVKKAFDDVYGNKPLILTLEQCTNTIQQHIQKYMSEKNSGEKAAGKKFLAENKKRPGVIELPNGLQYEIITQGTGPKPLISDTIKAHYIGTLINGAEFDNSYTRGTPLEIPVKSVIMGWQQALQMMPVGSKWKLYIPSELAYGEQGAGGVIPGGATLVFEMELLHILNK